MAEISWIKLKTAMFDDEKVKMIESMPEADAILVIWIKLLVLAGKTNDNGLIYIQRNMPYTDEMLSVLLNKQLSTIRLAIATLEKFKMIEVGENRELIISNWEKHQNIEGMDKIRQQNAERVAKHREKKKLLGNVTGNVTVTESNATDKNKNKNKSKNNKTIMSDKSDDVIPYSEIIEYLNEKTGRSFRNVDANKKLIKARWNDGYKLDDFKTVIDNMVANWSGKEFNGTPAENYLQPKTLFSNKFDSYLNQIPKTYINNDYSGNELDLPF